VLVRVQSVRLDESMSLWESVKEKISKIRGVLKTEVVFGRYNAVATIEVETPKELGDIVSKTIPNIRGVAEVDTLVTGY